ncbi:MAG TPA: undecaprenyldiphospho-muramoylpentapeptide beta-N-acetylglucosaminyltransferase [Pyrinomonadaceae bacterium]
MRALIAAGGTGGHIYPGIAVAKEIMRRDANSVVRFVGTAKGLETRLVPQAGFELSLIESAGLVNMSLAARARGAMVLPKSFVAARRLIRSFGPDIVVGAGGYVSGPVLLTAAMMRVPTLVMESNAVPGFTNRVLARFVRAAAVSFEAAAPHFRGKATVTGNPIRREFFDIREKERDSSGGDNTAARFSLLIFGGSQGARAVNEAMMAALPHLAARRDVLRVTHQTGKLDFERVRAAYEAAGWTASADVREYIDDMVSAFAAADLIISRAGATSSFELMAAGRPAIMVPLPGQLEQRKNAEALQQAGAARMILQNELSGATLAREIDTLVADPERVAEMGRKARSLARGDAAVATVDLIEKLTRGQRSEVRGQ